MSYSNEKANGISWAADAKMSSSRGTVHDDALARTQKLEALQCCKCY